MRNMVCLLSAVLALPSATSANAILITNSGATTINFGDWGAVHQAIANFEILKVIRDGVAAEGQWEHNLSSFEGLSGPLVSKVSGNENGRLTTTYTYDGGSFSMTLSLHNLESGQDVSGLFTAPIVGLMTVTVDEEYMLTITAFYMLGAGTFDTDLAAALGLRRKTLGGFVDDPWLTDGHTDPVSLERFAEDGVGTIQIRVPEPSAIALLSIPGVALLGRARRR